MSSYLFASSLNQSFWFRRSQGMQAETRRPTVPLRRQYHVLRQVVGCQPTAKAIHAGQQEPAGGEQLVKPARAYTLQAAVPLQLPGFQQTATSSAPTSGTRCPTCSPMHTSMSEQR